MKTNWKSNMYFNKPEFNKGSNFCREGQTIKGRYLGIEVQGKVLFSRVKYGGRVEHRVETTLPYEFLQEVRETGSIVLVDEDTVKSVELIN